MLADVAYRCGGSAGIVWSGRRTGFPVSPSSRWRAP